MAVSGKGFRDNKGKVSFSLVPLHLLAGCARVFMSGKLKYDAWNWAKGMEWSKCFDSLMRHLIKWWYLGEDVDEETGENHLDHILCNVLMLRHYTQTYKDGDDRPHPSICFGDSMDWFKEKFDEEEFLTKNPNLKIVEERNS